MEHFVIFDDDDAGDGSDKMLEGTREGKRVQPSGATAADLKCDVELARCVDIINIFYNDKGRKKDSSIVSTFHWLSNK